MKRNYANRLSADTRICDSEDESEAEEDLAAIKANVIDTMYRCIDRVLQHIARPYASCVRQSCRRSRRCRGTACLDDYDDD